MYLKNRIIIFFISLFRFVCYFFPSIFFISVYFVGFVSFRFHFVDFVSFRFVFVDFVSFRFVFVVFVSFRFVSFLFRFALYRYPINIGSFVSIANDVSQWNKLVYIMTSCETEIFQSRSVLETPVVTTISFCMNEVRNLGIITVIMKTFANAKYPDN